MFVFLSYWKNFVGTEKRVRIIHGKRAIRVRTIEVILYTVTRDNIQRNSKIQEELFGDHILFSYICKLC